MRKVDTIIVHCSDSHIGSAVIIDKWHREERRWNSIGYHFVINNGKYNDGHIELGRSLKVSGAHAYGHNEHSIGICLIGRPNANGRCEFSMEQIVSLIRLCRKLMKDYGIEKVIGHYEVDSDKTCPAIDMDKVRSILEVTNEER